MVCLMSYMNLKVPTKYHIFPVRALRVVGLLLADGALTVGVGEDFLVCRPFFFFYENGRNLESFAKEKVPSS